MDAIQYYVDQNGIYLGGYGGGANPPNGAIEVQKPPAHGLDKWVNGAWVANSNITIQAQIDALEHLITPRRIREATLNADGGWMKDIDARIAALRIKLV